jgi:LCP family protein required for cell wall assembly
MPVFLRRLLLALVIVSLCSAGAVAALDSYVRYRLGDLERIRDLPVDRSAGLHPMNIVLVGSDDRAAVAAEPSQFGSTQEVSGRRSDTILLARIDPAQRTVAVLSIPRDLYVPITGGDGSGRINDAFNQGGPTRLIQTIADNLRIPVHHYVEVDFSGFRELVDAAGGVRLWVPEPVRDYSPTDGRSMTGLDIRETGCVTLDGPTALAYVRSRYFQTLVNGRWRSDPTSDIGRMQRQQRFLLALAEAAAAQASGGDPRAVDRLAREAIRLVRVDDGLSSKEIVRLAGRMRTVRPRHVELLGPIPTVPFTGRRGEALLRLDPGPAAVALAGFDSELAPPPAPPSAAPAKPQTVPAQGPAAPAASAAPAPTEAACPGR